MATFFLQIVNMSIAAGWIVLAVVVLRLLLKKAPKWIAVLLWSIVAVRLVCPFSIESILSLLPSAETVSPTIMTDAAPAIHSGLPLLNSVVNPVLQSSFAPDPNALHSANPLQIIVPVLSLVWIIGMAAMLTYTIISYLHIRHKVRTAVRLQENIFQSEQVVSPFVLGFIRPKIYLPFDLKQQDLQHVIAHENAHISRKDHWWKPLGFLLLTLHWFNPLVWLAYLLLCNDIELACDEKVVKAMDVVQKADYSQALLTCSVNRRLLAACPLAFGEVGVKKRIKSVLHYKKPAFWVVVVAAVLSVIASVCLLTNPIVNTLGKIENCNLWERTAKSTSVLFSDGVNNTYVGAIDQDMLSELYSLKVSNEAISLSRDEERDKTNTLILNLMSANETETLTSYAPSTYIHFSTDFTSVWLDDGVKPTFSYTVLEPQKAKEIFWRIRNANASESTVGGADYDGSNIPKLNVTCNTASTEAVIGTTSWTFDMGNGVMQSINGDSSHPLAQLEYILPQALKIKQTDTSPLVADLHFNVAPDSITVNAWFLADNGKTKAFDAEVDGLAIRLNDGKEACLYEVVATWNKSSAYYGTVRYAFCVIKNDEIPFISSDHIFDAALSCAGWTEDSRIYFKALNNDKMTVSSIQHLPIYKFDTSDDLKQFKEMFGSTFTMDSGWDEVPSFNSVTAKYDHAFFEENSLLLVYVSANNCTHRFKVQNVGYDEKSICVHVTETTDAQCVDTAMAGWFVTVAVSDEFIKSRTDLDADLSSETMSLSADYTSATLSMVPAKDNTYYYVHKNDYYFYEDGQKFTKSIALS